MKFLGGQVCNYIGVAISGCLSLISLTLMKELSKSSRLRFSRGRKKGFKRISGKNFRP